eukprot:TRINITY_DN10668_c5_g1_i1.p1 TRINITY_DN10668_c5_g1~~TRINITY_DN10668_c5_g1_i1.p1  ORF type:complete len:577 (+),score=127.80 TRINITY_DN10668_c5_g1_i1:93-1823(+)
MAGHVPNGRRPPPRQTLLLAEMRMRMGLEPSGLGGDSPEVHSAYSDHCRALAAQAAEAALRRDRRAQSAAVRKRRAAAPAPATAPAPAPAPAAAEAQPAALRPLSRRPVTASPWDPWARAAPVAGSDSLHLPAPRPRRRRSSQPETLTPVGEAAAALARQIAEMPADSDRERAVRRAAQLAEYARQQELLAFAMTRRPEYVRRVSGRERATQGASWAASRLLQPAPEAPEGAAAGDQQPAGDKPDAAAVSSRLHGAPSPKGAGAQTQSASAAPAASTPLGQSAPQRPPALAALAVALPTALQPRGGDATPLSPTQAAPSPDVGARSPSLRRFRVVGHMVCAVHRHTKAGAIEEMKRRKLPFTHDEYRTLVSNFEALDKDKGGTLSFNEIQHLTRHMGRRRSISATEFKRIDKDRSGAADFTEVLQMLYPKLSRKDAVWAAQALGTPHAHLGTQAVPDPDAQTEAPDWQRRYSPDLLAEVREIFNHFSADGKTIRRADLMPLCQRHLGRPSGLTPSDLEALVFRHGARQFITFRDFVALMDSRDPEPDRAGLPNPDKEIRYCFTQPSVLPPSLRMLA